MVGWKRDRWALHKEASFARKPEKAFVDRGYRGHGYKGDIEVHVDKVRRGRTPKSLWRWMKKRASVEPSIGHLKQEHRMDRNRLKDKEGDRINAILSAAGMNFSKLLRWLADFFALFIWFGNGRSSYAPGKDIFAYAREIGFSESTI